MSNEEREVYHERAELEPMAIRLPPEVADSHSAHPHSPWGIGSSSYACSTETVQRTVQELLPEGRAWLRTAYERCRATKDIDAVASVVVRDERPKLDLAGLRRRRQRERTCWECHPGLCISEVNAMSVIAFHACLVQAMRSFNLDPENAPGAALFLFAGFHRKRDAVQAHGRPLHGDITGDAFEMAFLSDQPERRRGLNTFTRCKCVIDSQSTFHCGSYARLVQTETGVLDERVSFAFAKLLRGQCRHWCVHQLGYDDVVDEYHVVRAPLTT